MEEKTRGNALDRVEGRRDGTTNWMESQIVRWIGKRITK